MSGEWFVLDGLMYGGEVSYSPELWTLRACVERSRSTTSVRNLRSWRITFASPTEETENPE